MEKTKLAISLICLSFLLTGCAQVYSGYVTTTYPDAYDKVDTTPIPNEPSLKQQQEADRIEALREVMFDMPIDRSSEW